MREIIACALGCALFMLWMWVAHKKDKGVWSFFKRLPCEDYTGSAKRSADAQARPEEAERPALPKAVIVHLSFWDRQERRAMTAEEIEDGRQAWEAYKARMDAVRKVEQGGC